MTKTQHGIMACVIGATTWGINGVVSQFLLSNYPVEPSWVATIRMSLAGLLLTLMVIPKKSHLIRQMLHDPISLRHLIIFSIFGLIDLIGKGNLIIAQNFGAYSIEIYLACMIIYWIMTLIIEKGFSLLEGVLDKGIHMGHAQPGGGEQ